MAQEKLSAEAFLALQRSIEDLRNALRERGISIADEDGLAHFAPKVRDFMPEVTKIFKAAQFHEWRQTTFPAMEVDPNYIIPDLQYTFGRTPIKAVPEVRGWERAVSLNGFFADCRQLSGVVTLPDFPACITASDMFSNCTLLEELTTGNFPLVTNLHGYANSCQSLRKISFGSMPKVINIGAFCYANPNLRQVFLREGVAPKGECNHAFGQCPRLERIDGVVNFSQATTLDNAFVGCSSLEEVRIKGLKNSLQLNDSPKLSEESLRYLIDNATETRGGVITLSSQLSSRDELKETLEYVGAKAVDKGFSVVYR